MAQTIEWNNEGANNTAANISALGPQVLFADTVNVRLTDDKKVIQTTSRFATGDGSTLQGYQLLADDSAVETQFEQSVGKFTDGNLIFGYAPLTEIKSDIRDYIFYPTTGSNTEGLFTGVCNTTQSQDYTPAIVSNSRNILMISAEQAASLARSLS